MKLAIILLAASIIISVYYYPYLPDVMASHWGIDGEVNGYMPKLSALFLMPVVTIIMLALFFIIPSIDPLKENIKRFRKYYNQFILAIIALLFYVHVLSITANLGYDYNMNIMIIPAMAAIFYLSGVMMEHAKRNWFIGIRTPWTISSDAVWDKTHKVGSKLFKALGLLSLLSMLIINKAFYIVIVSALAFTLYLVIYSYLEYKKEKKL